MSIEKVTVQIQIIAGKGLAAKDRNLLGKKTTSDPFVEVWKSPHVPEAPAAGAKSSKPSKDQSMVGSTKTQYKTLDPEWNETFVVEFFEKETRTPHVLLKIFDEDKLSKPDAM